MGRVRFAVLGAGGIARRKTIPGMLAVPTIELMSVMDVVGAEQIAAEFGVRKACSTVDEVLADPEIDAVYIASPVFLHLE